MEIQLPDLGGIDALIAIRAEFPAARVIVLTACDGDVDVRRALKAGASGYLLKNTPPSELLQEIRKVHSGRKAIQPELAAKLAEHYRRRHPLCPRGGSASPSRCGEPEP